MKPFKYWKRQEIEETFGVREVEQHPLLEDWLNSTCSISEEEEVALEKLRKLLAKNVDIWNEAELKIKFLGRLFDLVDFDNDYYRAFMERKLSIHHNGETISGTVDFLIAKGRQIPRSPFFCVHEYKPDPVVTNDPLGQLLIGLEAVYQENARNGNSFPLYGTYVVGGFFYFVVFDGKTYAKSRPYVATRSEIQNVYCLLRQIKVYINAIIEKEQGELVA